MLKIGSYGKDVRDLQLRLKAAGYPCGAIDSAYGPKTAAAVKAFQADYEKLADTGVLDEETNEALDQALLIIEKKATAASVPSGPRPVACDPAIWQAFLDVMLLLTTKVGYGPGRGLFVDGHYVVTYGPGGLGVKDWLTQRPGGKLYPSFHCTSLTNFILGWLHRYNEDYTHAGNVPSLFKLCSDSRDLHVQQGASPYRGYGPYCSEIPSDGSANMRPQAAEFERLYKTDVIDMQEIYDRRQHLPAFMVAGQSTRVAGTWKTWHHTMLLTVDHASPGTPLTRWAADGYKDSTYKYSGALISKIPIDATTAPRFNSTVYRLIGVNTLDGTYGDMSRPLAPVILEN